MHVLLMPVPGCIYMYMRACECECVCEFVKQFLCSNFQSRHAPEIHSHLKHTKLDATLMLAPQHFSAGILVVYSC